VKVNIINCFFYTYLQDQQYNCNFYLEYGKEYRQTGETSRRKGFDSSMSFLATPKTDKFMFAFITGIVWNII